MARVNHPFATPTEMFNALGWPAGKWVPIPTAVHGSIQGLPHVSGIPVAANDKGHILLLRDDYTTIVCCRDNFVPSPKEKAEQKERQPRANPRIARYV